MDTLSLTDYFEVQRWMPYFKMLNGPTYTYLVMDLWVRAEFFDEVGGSSKVREILLRMNQTKGNQELIWD